MLRNAYVIYRPIGINKIRVPSAETFSQILLIKMSTVASVVN